MDTYWATFVQALKDHGPIVILFGIFIVWQSRRIDQLLDRNSSIYDAEIKRLAEVQDRLLTKLLGPQPSSSGSPTIKQVRDKAATDEVKKEN